MTERTTYQTGLWAECLCRWWLRIKGYTILAQRYRSPAGEIDLIARRGQVVVMVEVKARATYHQAMEAVSPRQRQRIERASHHFLARNPHLAAHMVRYDMMLVCGMFRLHHISHAWEAAF